MIASSIVQPITRPIAIPLSEGEGGAPVTGPRLYGTEKEDLVFPEGDPATPVSNTISIVGA